MSLKLEDGQAVDVEAANRQFEQAMSDTTIDEKVAPAPPRVEEPKAKPAAKRPAAKKASAAKTMTVPTSGQKAKWAEEGSNMMHTAAVVAATFHATTGDAAFEKDAELYVRSAEPFGQACASLASQSPGFAKFLESEGGKAGAYMTFGLISSQIVIGTLDNHGATGKMPLFFRGVAFKLKKLFKVKKRG